MKRREFLNGAAAMAAGVLALPPLARAQEKSKLKITGIRLVTLAPRRRPPNIYPEFKPTRKPGWGRDVVATPI